MYKNKLWYHLTHGYIMAINDQPNMSPRYQPPPPKQKPPPTFLCGKIVENL